MMYHPAGVALRKESVDRNPVAVGSLTTLGVALRKESVDRNFDTMQIVVVIVVALRKESVDRNMLSLSFPVAVGSSLSARRAWIEISTQCKL